MYLLRNKRLELKDRVSEKELLVPKTTSTVAVTEYRALMNRNREIEKLIQKLRAEQERNGCMSGWIRSEFFDTSLHDPL